MEFWVCWVCVASNLEKLAQAFAQAVAPAKEPAPIEDGSKVTGCCISPDQTLAQVRHGWLLYLATNLASNKHGSGKQRLSPCDRSDFARQFGPGETNLPVLAMGTAEASHWSWLKGRPSFWDCGLKKQDMTEEFITCRLKNMKFQKKTWTSWDRGSLQFKLMCSGCFNPPQDCDPWTRPMRPRWNTMTRFQEQQDRPLEVRKIQRLQALLWSTKQAPPPNHARLRREFSYATHHLWILGV